MPSDHDRADSKAEFFGALGQVDYRVRMDIVSGTIMPQSWSSIALL